MRSGEYWKERMELLQENLMQKADALVPELEQAYQNAENNIQKEIESFYQRYAQAEKISFVEAKQNLTSLERKHLAMSLQQYIRVAQDADADPKWIKALEKISMRRRITRLEALKLQIRQQIEILAGHKSSGLTKTLGEIFEEGFYRTTYEIQKGLGVGAEFSTLDVRKINTVLAKPWSPDGESFSQRIWKDRAKLLHEMDTTLTEGIITGASPQRIITRMQKALGSSRNVTGRLVLSEGAAFSSIARKESYNQLKVEEYQYLATLDGSPCSRCTARDLKVFPMADYAIGVTAPPLHPFCRCTTVPYFKDEFSAGGQRAARNEKDKVYYIPEDMTYGEWKKTFVDGKKDNLTALKIPEFKGQNMQKAYEDFAEMLSHSNGEDRVVTNLNFYSQTTEYVEDRNEGAFGYDPKEDVIRYNPYADNFELYDMNYVLVHELTHRMDICEFKSWKHKNFIRAVDNCSEKLYSVRDEIERWFVQQDSKYAKDIALADIISALSKGEFDDILGFSHHKDYWREDDGIKVYLEIFANIASIDVLGYESKAEFSGLLKEIYEAYKEVVKWT